MNEKEFILCAAIKRKEESTAHHCYHEQYCDIYKVELGWRHADILYKFKDVIDQEEQGFFTSFGRYVNREDAAKIAFNAGQIKEPKRILYSEDLY